MFIYIINDYYKNNNYYYKNKYNRLINLNVNFI
jgi:hypothetical protein